MRGVWLTPSPPTCARAHTPSPAPRLQIAVEVWQPSPDEGGEDTVKLRSDWIEQFESDLDAQDGIAEGPATSLPHEVLHRRVETCLGRVERAQQQLNARHIVLGRAHRQLAAACHAALSRPGADDANPSLDTVLRLLRAALASLATMELSLPPDHCDVAVMAEHAQLAIARLLGARGGDRAMFAMGIDAVASFPKASRLELELRRRHQRIRALYKAGEEGAQAVPAPAAEPDTKPVQPAAPPPSQALMDSLFD